eukprot:UC4_evm2s769
MGDNPFLEDGFEEPEDFIPVAKDFRPVPKSSVKRKSSSTSSGSSIKKGVKMEAIGSHEASDDSELSFAPGDMIFVVLKDPSKKIWKGVFKGKVGTFPSHLVQEHDEEERKKDLEEAKKRAEEKGVKVEVIRCKAIRGYESQGAGELSIQASWI